MPIKSSEPVQSPSYHKQCKFDHHNKQHTYKELIERFINDGALEHLHSARNTLRHALRLVPFLLPKPPIQIQPDFIRNL